MDRASRLGLILYMLALHPRGLSAERLATYIASDSVDLDAFDTDVPSTTDWLGTVRTFIWRLRKKAGWYGIVLSPGEMGGCSNMYRLPAGTTCDLWEFERYLDQSARQALRADVDPYAAGEAAAMRQEAILLYQGDFCKGVSAGCVSYPAEQLRNRYLQAVMQQGAYWKDKAIRLGTTRPKEQEQGVSAQDITSQGSIEEQNAWLEALSNYRLAVQVEPYDEVAYKGSMQCLAHLGDSKGVQETFARCCRVIQAELGRPPLASTVHSARKCLELARAG
jgi:DNA-binding SARP family transcriptional activator